MDTEKSNNLVTKSEFYGAVSKNNYMILNKTHLSQKYFQNILAYDLILKQNYANIMQLPRIEKILLNTTSKKYVLEKKYILFTLTALEIISGQKPKLTYARKSVANFKIRENQILGCKVVLQKNLMYAFLDKLSRIIFPRIRDYNKKKINLGTHQSLFSLKKKMLNKSWKLKAYTFGLKNLMIFPELENHFQLVENFQGMNLTFVLSGFSDKKKPNKTNKSEELLLFLSGFQLPLN